MNNFGKYPVGIGENCKKNAEMIKKVVLMFKYPAEKHHIFKIPVHPVNEKGKNIYPRSTEVKNPAKPF